MRATFAPACAGAPEEGEAPPRGARAQVRGAMSGVSSLNANAEVMGRQAALFMNINAAKGLEDVMKTNLGPKGTIKMLVSGAGGAGT